MRRMAPPKSSSISSTVRGAGAGAYACEYVLPRLALPRRAAAVTAAPSLPSRNVDAAA
jgi:hypothetical protein